MLGLQYQKFGDPSEVIACDDVAPPVPGQGEVRLRVLLSPIHNHDLATIRGTYGVRPPLPAIGGTELFGTVEELGAGVNGLAANARVAAVIARGAWAQHAIANAAGVVPIPAAIPDDVAAQLLAMPLSAIALFDELHVSAGDWIAQNAANGAVGRILMRVAQKAGVHVINLVRRESAAEELRGYGAEHVAVQSEGWAERVREMTGGAPIARVVDSVCDENSIVLNRMLGKRGEHIVFGALASRALALDPGALIFGQTVVRGFWMSAWMVEADAQRRMAAIGKCLALAANGELPLPVAARHPLVEAATALRQAQEPGRPGKILFAPWS